MIKLSVSLLFVLTAGAAVAQTATTNCQQGLPGSINCRTTFDEGIDWNAGRQSQNAGQAFLDGFERGRQQRLIEQQNALIREQNALLQQLARQRSQAEAPPPPPQADPKQAACNAAFHKAFSGGQIEEADRILRECN